MDSDVGIFIDANIILGLLQCGQKLIYNAYIAKTVVGDGWHDPLFPGQGGKNAILIEIHCFFQ